MRLMEFNRDDGSPIYVNTEGIFYVSLHRDGGNVVQGVTRVVGGGGTIVLQGEPRDIAESISATIEDSTAQP